MIGNVHLVQPDTLEEIGNVDNAPPVDGQIKRFSAATGKWENVSSVNIQLDLGGIWGLQNNEVNAIGVNGIIDTNHTQDLGNAGALGTPTIATVLNSAGAGGYMCHVDCKVKRLRVNYRQNNTGASVWGFLIFKQAQVSGANGGTGVAILDDIANSVNRVAAANNQQTIIDETTFEDVTISAGEMICFANRCVTSNANLNLQIKAGFIELEPV